MSTKRTTMAMGKAYSFSDEIRIIGINPCVMVPDKILVAIFKQAGRDKSPIPIKGKVNGVNYRQTLVRHKGAWRLYINTTMLKNSPKHIGETVTITIQYDPAKRTVAPHPKLIKALNKNPVAKKKFMALTSSRRMEMIKYLSHLKTEASVERNVGKIIGALLGRNTFFGIEK